MTLFEQIDDFSRYAKEFVLRESVEIPIDELYDQWRAEAFHDEDLRAIKASVRDYEDGQCGRPMAKFLSEFDGERTAEPDA